MEIAWFLFEKLFRNDITPFWTFLDPYTCHQESQLNEHPLPPPLGDVICEQLFSQKSKVPTYLKYSLTQQALSYANITHDLWLTIWL